MSFFDIENIFFTVSGYQMSYLEFFGTIAGAVYVWLSANGNIWNWPVGIINVVLFFFLFYQVQLYPDMFLQVFFLITNLVGWWRWANPKPGEENRKNELRASFMGWRQFLAISILGMVGTYFFGTFAKNLHEIISNGIQSPERFPVRRFFCHSYEYSDYFLYDPKKDRELDNLDHRRRPGNLPVLCQRNKICSN